MVDVPKQPSCLSELLSKDDIADVMGSVKKGDNIVLWCDGLLKETELHVNAKPITVLTDEHPRNVKKEDRGDKVQRCIEELKEKHGEPTYIPMQYCIWAELLSGGVIAVPLKQNPPTQLFLKHRKGKVMLELVLNLKLWD